MSDNPPSQRNSAPSRRRAIVQVGGRGQAPNNPIRPCPHRYIVAPNFLQLIRQVEDAERMLALARHTTADKHAAIFRGIYYGTDWSADFLVERSPVRNAAFQIYTGTLAPPADPRPILICNLFESLRTGRDIAHTDGRHLDVGHMYIGIHARQSIAARSAPIPSQGGTGLEISTWLGDLGGGCGMLAINRSTAPTTLAITKFRGGNFGDSRNLEGDVAGFLVAAPLGASSPVAPTDFGTVDGLASAMTDYLSPAAPSSAWTTRARRFLAMYGVSLPLTPGDRSALVERFADKIEDFGVWYLVNRLRQNSRLTSAKVRSCAVHVHGAAQEMAEIFVDALVFADSHPNRPLKAQGSGAAASPPGVPNVGLSRVADAIDRSNEAQQWAEDAAQAAEETYDQAQRNFRRWINGLF